MIFSMCKEWVFLCPCFIWRHKLGYERLTLSVNVCVGLFNMYQPWGCIDTLSKHVYTYIYVYIYAYMLEKAMATQSSTLAWKIPWMEEPGRLQSMGSLGVGHDWVTSLSLSLSCIREGNGNPLQCSCLENPRDGGSWWAAVYGVSELDTTEVT